jgi:hypothetical protein
MGVHHGQAVEKSRKTQTAQFQEIVDSPAYFGSCGIAGQPVPR